jgi:hypothetical protein
VLLASVDLACFDGKRHLTEKLDATSLVWARAVELRAVAGAAFALMGGPLGAAVVSTMRGRQ